MAFQDKFRHPAAAAARSETSWSGIRLSFRRPPRVGKRKLLIVRPLTTHIITGLGMIHRSDAPVMISRSGMAAIFLATDSRSACAAFWVSAESAPAILGRALSEVS